MSQQCPNCICEPLRTELQKVCSDQVVYEFEDRTDKSFKNPGEQGGQGVGLIA